MPQVELNSGHLIHFTLVTEPEGSRVKVMTLDMIISSYSSDQLCMSKFNAPPNMIHIQILRYYV